MTLRLLKKRQTTVQTSKRAKLAKLVLYLAGASVSMGMVGELAAQQPASTGRQVNSPSYPGQLRPVPKAGFERSTGPATRSQHQSRDLSWRKSTSPPHGLETPVPKATSLQLMRTSPTTQGQSVIRQVSGESMTTPSHNTTLQSYSSRRNYAGSGLQLAKTAPTLHSINGVGNRATSQIQPLNTNVPTSDVSNAAWNGSPPANAGPEPNYFADPFSDNPPTASLNLPTIPSPAMVRQESSAHPRSRHAESMPMELRPANGLRNNIAQLELPTTGPPAAVRPNPVPPAKPRAVPPAELKAVPELRIPTQAAPLELAPPQAKTAPVLPRQAPQIAPPAVPALPPRDEPATPPAANPVESKPGTSLGEIMKKRSPSDQGTELKTPSTDTAPSLRGETVPPSKPFSEQIRNADQIDRDRLNRDEKSKRRYGIGEDVLEDLPFSCEDFRKRIASQTIDQVSLDISPPYRPDEMDEKRYQGLKEEFDEKQSIRTWHDRDGNALTTGRLNDLAYEKAVVETNDGSKDTLPINQLSEGDIAYIADNWGLPKECLIEQVAYTPRKWTPSTMTWKASNLCHHPLYFEDVNLERYGHTRGPLLEPVVQSAHFFANIAILPYKMGVHCPSECQYALGYYRPGNCSPWIKPPVPISARGAIAQAATMTGMFWLIP